MPKLSDIFRHGRGSKSQSEIPPNSGNPRASSSTIESYNASSGWNSPASLGSRGLPEREPLQRVPENAADYRTTAELDTPRNGFWGSVPNHITPQVPQQARYYQQHEQQSQQQPQPQPQQFHQHLHQHQIHHQPEPQVLYQEQHRAPYQEQHQVPYQEQHQQHGIVNTDEANISRARQANDIIAQRNEEKRILERRRNASADNVRRLRDLIRERYALDLFIWEKRTVPKAVRRRIEPRCKKADAILQEIYFIVNAWDEDLFDEQEWQIVKRIKARLSTKPLENGESGEPAIWGDLAPWDRPDGSDRRLPTAIGA